MQPKKPLRAKTALKTKTPLKAALKPKKQPKPTISKLKKEADKWFSQYVRLRDKGICITCRGVGNQAGHFMSRRYNATRFDDENVNAQCYRCNVLFYGEQYKYAIELDLKYGSHTAKKLALKAKNPHPFTTEELQQIIDESKEQVEWYTSLNKENLGLLN